MISLFVLLFNTRRKFPSIASFLTIVSAIFFSFLEKVVGFQQMLFIHLLKEVYDFSSLTCKGNTTKTSTSASVTAQKPLTVCIITNWKILKEMGISDHLSCLLRNLDTGKEATVRTRHGRVGWFKIGKGVHQGCVLSPCLFNLYAEYIM